MCILCTEGFQWRRDWQRSAIGRKWLLWTGVCWWIEWLWIQSPFPSMRLIDMYAKCGSRKDAQDSSTRCSLCYAFLDCHVIEIYGNRAIINPILLPRDEPDQCMPNAWGGRTLKIVQQDAPYLCCPRLPCYWEIHVGTAEIHYWNYWRQKTTMWRCATESYHFCGILDVYNSNSWR